MVGTVRKRLFKPLVYLLVAAQLLLAVPAMATTIAFSAGASSASASVPCDQMTPSDHSDECPCCPVGGMSMASCLASCAVAAAMPARDICIRVSALASRVEALPSIRFASLSSPPLKPPPIY
jgi:hypothetical protein